MDALVKGLLLGAVALIWAIVLVRIIGARTLSKMSAFDFVVTLATGSLLATAAASAKMAAFIQALAAMAMLLLLQYLLSLARQRSDSFKRLIENEPVLLVRDGQFLNHALRRSRVCKADIYAKLRQADIGDLSQVSAIVLETTGDISILTNRASTDLMAGVRERS